MPRSEGMERSDGSRRHPNQLREACRKKDDNMKHGQMSPPSFPTTPDRTMSLGGTPDSSTPNSFNKHSKRESYKAQKRTYRSQKKEAAKELLSTITDPAVVLLGDWLKVRGTLKSWTKLWCVLKPGVLILYKSDKHKGSQWVGTILLNTCQLLERPSKKDGFCFKLFHPLEQSIWATKGPKGETIGAFIQPLPYSYCIFRAPSEAAGKCWMDALELALKCTNLLKRSMTRLDNTADAAADQELEHSRHQDASWSTPSHEEYHGSQNGSDQMHDGHSEGFGDSFNSMRAQERSMNESDLERHFANQVWPNCTQLKKENQRQMHFEKKFHMDPKEIVSQSQPMWILKSEQLPAVRPAQTMVSAGEPPFVSSLLSKLASLKVAGVTFASSCQIGEEHEQLAINSQKKIALDDGPNSVNQKEMSSKVKLQLNTNNEQVSYNKQAMKPVSSRNVSGEMDELAKSPDDQYHAAPLAYTHAPTKHTSSRMHIKPSLSYLLVKSVLPQQDQKKVSSSDEDGIQNLAGCLKEEKHYKKVNEGTQTSLHSIILDIDSSTFESSSGSSCNIILYTTDHQTSNSEMENTDSGTCLKSTDDVTEACLGCICECTSLLMSTGTSFDTEGANSETTHFPTCSCQQKGGIQQGCTTEVNGVSSPAVSQLGNRFKLKDRIGVTAENLESHDIPKKSDERHAGDIDNVQQANVRFSVDQDSSKKRSRDSTTSSSDATTKGSKQSSYNSEFSYTTSANTETQSSLEVKSSDPDTRPKSDLESDTTNTGQKRLSASRSREDEGSSTYSDQSDTNSKSSTLLSSGCTDTPNISTQKSAGSDKRSTQDNQSDTSSQSSIDLSELSNVSQWGSSVDQNRSATSADHNESNVESWSYSSRSRSRNDSLIPRSGNFFSSRGKMMANSQHSRKKGEKDGQRHIQQKKSRSRSSRGTAEKRRKVHGEGGSKHEKSNSSTTEHTRKHKKRKQKNKHGQEREVSEETKSDGESDKKDKGGGESEGAGKDESGTEGEKKKKKKKHHKKREGGETGEGEEGGRKKKKKKHHKKQESVGEDEESGEEGEKKKKKRRKKKESEERKSESEEGKKGSESESGAGEKEEVSKEGEDKSETGEGKKKKKKKKKKESGSEAEKEEVSKEGEDKSETGEGKKKKKKKKKKESGSEAEKEEVSKEGEDKSETGEGKKKKKKKKKKESGSEAEKEEVSKEGGDMSETGEGKKKKKKKKKKESGSEAGKEEVSKEGGDKSETGEGKKKKKKKKKKESGSEAEKEEVSKEGEDKSETGEGKKKKKKKKKKESGSEAEKEEVSKEGGDESETGEGKKKKKEKESGSEAEKEEVSKEGGDESETGEGKKKKHKKGKADKEGKESSEFGEKEKTEDKESTEGETAVSSEEDHKKKKKKKKHKKHKEGKVEEEEDSEGGKLKEKTDESGEPGLEKETDKDKLKEKETEEQKAISVAEQESKKKETEDVQGKLTEEGQVIKDTEGEKSEGKATGSERRDQGEKAPEYSGAEAASEVQLAIKKMESDTGGATELPPAAPSTDAVALGSVGASAEPPAEKISEEKELVIPADSQKAAAGPDTSAEQPDSSTVCIKPMDQPEVPDKPPEGMCTGEKQEKKEVTTEPASLGMEKGYGASGAEKPCSAYIDKSAASEGNEKGGFAASGSEVKLTPAQGGTQNMMEVHTGDTDTESPSSKTTRSWSDDEVASAAGSHLTRQTSTSENDDIVFEMPFYLERSGLWPPERPEEMEYSHLCPKCMEVLREQGLEDELFGLDNGQYMSQKCRGGPKEESIHEYDRSFPSARGPPDTSLPPGSSAAGHGPPGSSSGAKYFQGTHQYSGAKTDKSPQGPGAAMASQPKPQPSSNGLDEDKSEREDTESSQSEFEEDVLPEHTVISPPEETNYVMNSTEELGQSGDDCQTEEVNDENKGLIWTLVKQVRPGMDLSKVVLPTFILEPRSFLDKISDYYYHADILSGAVLEESPYSRMKSVVRWYLSGFYKKPKGLKKPYNPVIGETFRCCWHHPATGSRTFYIAEQVSHHPPISVFHVTNRKDGFNISGSILARSKFYGNSLSAILDGVATLSFLERGEDYFVTMPYAHCKGILIGTLTMELGGKVTIDCPKTGYKCDLEFKLKPFLGSGQASNRIHGKIKMGSDVLATIDGHWDQEIFIKDHALDKTKELFWNPTPEVRAARLKRFTVPVNEQCPYESERLWEKVSEAVVSCNMHSATNEKYVIEEEQRKNARDRKLNKTEWVPRYFEKVHPSGGEWIYKHADDRPWDPVNDVYQYEKNFVVQTQTRHKTPHLRAASLSSLNKSVEKKKLCIPKTVEESDSSGHGLHRESDSSDYLGPRGGKTAKMTQDDINMLFEPLIKMQQETNKALRSVQQQVSRLEMQLANREGKTDGQGLLAQSWMTLALVFLLQVFLQWIFR